MFVVDWTRHLTGTPWAWVKKWPILEAFTSLIQCFHRSPMCFLSGTLHCTPVFRRLLKRWVKQTARRGLRPLRPGHPWPAFPGGGRTGLVNHGWKDFEKIFGNRSMVRVQEEAGFRGCAAFWMDSVDAEKKPCLAVQTCSACEILSAFAVL